MAEEQKGEVTAQSPPPGAIIAPGGTPAPAPPPPAADQPQQPAETQSPYALPENAPVNKSQEPGTVSWTASEFISHEKSAGWYARLALAAIAGAGIVFLLTHDKISAGIVIIAALFFGGYAARKPRLLEYKVTADGVGVGQKFHIYDEFRAFSVVPEGAFSSIVFMPHKRFATLTTIYYAPEDEDKILDVLEEVLPYEDYSHDVLDQFLRRVRF